MILVFAKSNADGFNILWRYFAWSNQSLSLFAFLAITVWMFETGRGKYAWMPLIPGCWYAFVTVTYIVNAKIGFNVPWMGAYIIGIVAAAAYLIILVWYGKKRTAAKAAKAGSEREINRKETIIKNMKKAGNYQTLSSGGYPLCRFHFLINM